MPDDTGSPRLLALRTAAIDSGLSCPVLIGRAPRFSYRPAQLAAVTWETWNCSAAGRMPPVVDDMLGQAQPAGIAQRRITVDHEGLLDVRR